MASSALQKCLGAFYTSTPVARILVDWAVRRPSDTVLDPACGDGAFLQAASQRIASLRGAISKVIYGVEIDNAIAATVLAQKLKQIGIPLTNIRVADFFGVDPLSLPRFKAIVGNPPFIRYQTFKGEKRDRALAVIRTLGISLTQLTSSWAPFLLNATRFLSPGGRLAMVVPAEISHASYARPVLEYLMRCFRTVVIAGFSERLFPDLSQDTYLLFADHFGGTSRNLSFRMFPSVAECSASLQSSSISETKVTIRQLTIGKGRLRNHFLPPDLSALYSSVGACAQVCRLGAIAKIGIGYVTGANDFFHLCQREVDEWGIPKSLLRKTLTRSGIAKGLRIAKQDWDELRSRNEKVYLLAIARNHREPLPNPVHRYLKHGMKHGIHLAYKCTVRKPWYSVPIGDPADTFLTYMSGDTPRIVRNEYSLLATNSLHEMRFHKNDSNYAWKLPLAFCCSLSQLSSEIEGHPLGGGMLKLEPSEAEQVMVVQPAAIRASESDFLEIEALVRANRLSDATDLADQIVLRDTLALTWRQIQLIRQGRDQIKESRRKKIAASISD